MSSIRKLKKEINCLVDEIIGNCFLHYYFVEKNKQKKIDKLIEDIVAFRNDIINKINNPSENLKSKSKRSYYRDIHNELIEKANKTFEKIDQLKEAD